MQGTYPRGGSMNDIFDQDHTIPVQNPTYPMANLKSSTYAAPLTYNRPTEALGGYDTQVNPMTGQEMPQTNFARGGHVAPQAGIASLLAARGRNGDSTLVHMTPREVQGLRHLAAATGNQMTVNPHTGLYEASWLNKLMPMLIGGGLTLLSGGALSPLAAAAITGAGYGAAKGDLKEGLMAGLGAYGGAGLAGSLAGAGATALEPLSEITPTAAPVGAGAAGAGTGTLTANQIGTLSEGTLSAEQAAQVAQAAQPAATASATPAAASVTTPTEKLAALQEYNQGSGVAYNAASPPTYGDKFMAGVKGLDTEAGIRSVYGGLNTAQKIGLATDIGGALSKEYTPIKEAPTEYYVGGRWDPKKLRFVPGHYTTDYPSMAEGGSVRKFAIGGSLGYGTSGAELLGDPSSTFYDAVSAAGRDDVDGTGGVNIPVDGTGAVPTEGPVTTMASAYNPLYTASNYTRYSSNPTAQRQAVADYMQSLNESFMPGPIYTYDIGRGIQAQPWNMNGGTVPGTTSNTSTGGGGGGGGDGGVGLSGIVKPTTAGLTHMSDQDLVNFYKFHGIDINAINAANAANNAAINTPEKVAELTDWWGATFGDKAGTGTTPAITYQAKASELPEAQRQSIYNTMTGGDAKMDQADIERMIAQTLMNKKNYTSAPVTFDLLKQYDPAAYAKVVSGVSQYDKNLSAAARLNQDVLYDELGFKNEGWSSNIYDKPGETLAEHIAAMVRANELYNKQHPDYAHGTDFGILDAATIAAMTPEQLARYGLNAYADKYNPIAKKAGTDTPATTASVQSVAPTQAATALEPAASTQASMLTKEPIKENIVDPGMPEDIYDYDYGLRKQYGNVEEYPFAHGGLASFGDTYKAGGKLLRGPGDGMSDSIPAVIKGKQVQRAALADGEFVIPADVVSHLGNGSTDAGSRKLYAMMDKVRRARTGNPRQGKQINPDKFLPA